MKTVNLNGLLISYCYSRLTKGDNVPDEYEDGLPFTILDLSVLTRVNDYSLFPTQQNCLIRPENIHHCCAMHCTLSVVLTILLYSEIVRFQKLEARHPQA